jgi:hypothetical protein
VPELMGTRTDCQAPCFAGLLSARHQGCCGGWL